MLIGRICMTVNKKKNNCKVRFGLVIFYVFHELYDLQNSYVCGLHTAVKRSARAQFLRNSRQNFPYKVLNFPKTFAFKKPEVNAISGKLRFIRCLWIGNLIIHLHWVSQLEMFFHRTISVTISYKRSPTFESKVRGGKDRMWRQLLRLTVVKWILQHGEVRNKQPISTPTEKISYGYVYD